MAKAKTQNKKPAKNNRTASPLAKLEKDLLGLVKKAKKTYEGMDDQTKKNIAAGLAGAAALVAGVIGYKKMRKK